MMIPRRRAAPLLAPLVLALSVPVAADPDRSNAFAEEAEALLMSGDRHGALVAAMKGLPADPTPADFETYAAAHDMLFRAAAARVFRLDRFGPQFFTVNATGDRAVIGGSVARVEPLPPLDGSATLEDLRARMDAGRAAQGAIDPYALVDPRDGRLVAELVPADILASDDLVWGPARPPAFSPDGAHVALWAMDESEAWVFSAEDGTRVATLQDPGAVVPGGIVGFSHDGARFATSSAGQVAVWDVATWQRVESHDIGALDGPVALAWSQPGDLLVVAGTRASEYTWGPFTFYRLTPDGLDPLLEEVPGVSDGWLGVLASPFGPVVVLESGVEATMVDLATGDVTGLPGGGARFLRRGTALGVREMRFDPVTYMPVPGHDIYLRSLDGRDLEPDLRDWPVFEQFVADLEGRPLDAIGPHWPFAYRGDDVPMGRSLYETVLSDLPEEDRAEIAAERIAHP
jgi:hypothetical protein